MQTAQRAFRRRPVRESTRGLSLVFGGRCSGFRGRVGIRVQNNYVAVFYFVSMRPVELFGNSPLLPAAGPTVSVSHRDDPDTLPVHSVEQ